MSELQWKILTDMATMGFFLACACVMLAKFTIRRRMPDLVLGLALLCTVPIFLLRVAGRPSPPLLTPALISNGVSMFQTIAIVLGMIWAILLLVEQHRINVAEIRLKQSLEKKEGNDEP